MKQPSTPQEIFDYVIPKMLKQGVLSVSTDKHNQVSCLYRKNKATHCAIGWIIPDEFYREEFEGKAIVQLIEAGYLKDLPAFTFENLTFLEDFQEAHDSLHSLVKTYTNSGLIKELIKNFEALAETYDLASAVLTKNENEKA